MPWFGPLLTSDDDADQLTTDELKTVVVEGATSVGERQRMLTRILDLESVTVDDIMVPRAEIAAINIDDVTPICHRAASQHTLLPVYKDSFDHVLGILHLRRVARLIFNEDFSKADLLQLTREPYYVPEATLHTQLFNFQKESSVWRWSSMNMAIFRVLLRWKTYSKKLLANLPATMLQTCQRFPLRKMAAS